MSNKQKLTPELFESFKQVLLGEDEDAVQLTVGILEQYEKDDLYWELQRQVFAEQDVDEYDEVDINIGYCIINRKGKIVELDNGNKLWVSKQHASSALNNDLSSHTELEIINFDVKEYKDYLLKNKYLQIIPLSEYYANNRK